MQNEFLFLAVIMDLYTRAIRGWSLGRTLGEELTQAALDKALAEHGAPKIHHSDHGIQYAAKGYVSKLREHGTRISMAAVGRPTENAYCERLMRTLKEEEVQLNEYEDLDDALARIGHFLEEVYTRRRVHSALGYVTPAEFEEAYRHKQRRKRRKGRGHRRGRPKKEAP